MMKHMRRYLSWLLMLVVLAIAVATTGCAVRFRYRDRDHHRRDYPHQNYEWGRSERHR